MITRNSDFSLPRMISCVKVKFRVIIFHYRAKNDNLELGISTSKHDLSYVKVKELFWTLSSLFIIKATMYTLTDFTLALFCCTTYRTTKFMAVEL